VPGGPKPSAHKLMVVWHPSSRWLFVGGEYEHVRPPWISPEQDLGLVQSGLNLDMYVTNPGGTAWPLLVGFAGRGYTGPAVASDGRVYYAEIVDGNILAYTFGKWILKRADFVVGSAGVPSLQNALDVTPPSTNWVEPGNISADGKY